MNDTKIRVELQGQDKVINAGDIKVNGISLEVWFASVKEIEKKLNKLQSELDKKEEDFKKIALELF